MTRRPHDIRVIVAIAVLLAHPPVFLAAQQPATDPWTAILDDSSDDRNPTLLPPFAILNFEFTRTDMSAAFLDDNVQFKSTPSDVEAEWRKALSYAVSAIDAFVSKFDAATLATTMKARDYKSFGLKYFTYPTIYDALVAYDKEEPSKVMQSALLQEVLNSTEGIAVPTPYSLSISQVSVQNQAGVEPKFTWSPFLSDRSSKLLRHLTFAGSLLALNNANDLKIASVELNAATSSRTTAADWYARYENPNAIGDFEDQASLLSQSAVLAFCTTYRQALSEAVSTLPEGSTLSSDQKLALMRQVFAAENDSIRVNLTNFFENAYIRKEATDNLSFFDVTSNFRYSSDASLVPDEIDLMSLNANFAYTFQTVKQSDNDIQFSLKLQISAAASAFPTKAVSSSRPVFTTPDTATPDWGFGADLTPRITVGMSVPSTTAGIVRVVRLTADAVGTVRFGAVGYEDLYLGYNITAAYPITDALGLSASYEKQYSISDLSSLAGTFRIQLTILAGQ